jgi:type I restriction enzyme M protein
LTAADLKPLLKETSWREEEAPQVIAKAHQPGKTAPDPLHGLLEAEIGGMACVVEVEPDVDLRDSEQIPLLEAGGIEAFIRREVLPYSPDAWVNAEATKVGYEVSFRRHFHKPKPLRSLAEIAADIRAIGNRRPRGWWVAGGAQLMGGHGQGCDAHDPQQPP